MPSTKKSEHSTEIRSMAIMCCKKGDSLRSIGKQLGISHSTVQSFLLKSKETGSVQNKVRSGRPQKLNTDEIKKLKDKVLENQQSRTTSLSGITSDLNSTLTKNVSESTVRRKLKAEGITCHAAAIKPFVSDANALKRVEWCKKRLHWKIEDWEKVFIYT